MAITSENDIAAGLSVAQRQQFIKNFSAPKSAGAFQSGWLATGTPGAGSTPPLFTAGSGYACDSTTVGGLAYTNGAVQNYLAALVASITQPGTLIIADRLWSCQGFVAATLTAQAVTTPGALPARITDAGVGTQLWLEQFATGGAASGTTTANYLNTAAAAKTAVIAAAVSAPVSGQFEIFPLQAGDVGISQLTSITFSATHTSGTIGATIVKPLMYVSVAAANIGIALDYAQLGVPKLPANACLMFAFLAQNTTAPVALGVASFIDK